MGWVKRGGEGGKKHVSVMGWVKRFGGGGWGGRKKHANITLLLS